jgi:hypothetical protein
VTRLIDNRWITVWNTAFCLAERRAETGADTFRIDLSWSPAPDHFESVIRTLLSGHCPEDTHSANADRSLA